MKNKTKMHQRICFLLVTGVCLIMLISQASFGKNCPNGSNPCPPPDTTTWDVALNTPPEGFAGGEAISAVHWTGEDGGVGDETIPNPMDRPDWVSGELKSEGQTTTTFDLVCAGIINTTATGCALPGAAVERYYTVKTKALAGITLSLEMEAKFEAAGCSVGATAGSIYKFEYSIEQSESTKFTLSKEQCYSKAMTVWSATLEDDVEGSGTVELWGWEDPVFGSPRVVMKDQYDWEDDCTGTRRFVNNYSNEHKIYKAIK